MQISIIMPYYNAAVYISETVGAIIAQTFQDWELIIVDDCSPAPETAEVLNQVKGMEVCRNARCTSFLFITIQIG